jgi:hypothetical protein
MFRKPTKARDGAGWICSTETKSSDSKPSQILNAGVCTSRNGQRLEGPKKKRGSFPATLIAGGANLDVSLASRYKID